MGIEIRVEKKTFLSPLRHGLSSILPQSRNWAINIWGLTIHNVNKDTPIKLRFRSHKSNEKIVKFPCWNSLLICIRGKIASRKKYCYDYHISKWYYMGKTKCSKMNISLSSKNWVFFFFVFCNWNWFSFLRTKSKLMHTNLVN